MNADWKSGPLFAGISEEGVDQVLACLSARPRHFDKQAMLLRAGDAPVMGVVLAGSVHILQEDFWGNRSLLGRAGPGDLFAEAFACAGVLRLPVSVEACEPTDVLLLDAGRLMVHPRCERLIGELEGYLWDSKAQERGEDRPIKQDDHAVDALRYGLMHYRRDLRRLISEGEHV